MIKALVSIEMDLASSMAVRLACQLGGLMEMEIHPVYAKKSPSHEESMGAGWASRTWQREMIEEGRQEISQLLLSEQDFCPVLRDPRIIYGDREAELVKIMHTEGFNLYLEGVHFSWTPHDILRTLHGKLYQGLGSPFVLVRTLRKINKVALLCLNTAQTDALTKVFQSMWQGSSVPLAFACPEKSVDAEDGSALAEAVDRGKKLLEDSGCVTEVLRLPNSAPSGDVSDVLSEHSLVAVSPERDLKKECPELQWLSQVKTASLLAFH